MKLKLSMLWTTKINFAPIIIFNDIHLINVNIHVVNVVLNNCVVLFGKYRLSQGTKAQSNLPRIMSTDCNRRTDWYTAAIWDTAGCLAVDAKHIFSVYVAANHIRRWLFYAESFIFRSPWHHITDGCGRNNIQYCYNWYEILVAAISLFSQRRKPFNCPN